MTRAPLCIVALLAVLPAVAASPEKETLYLHHDGAMASAPDAASGSSPWTATVFHAPPAAMGYTLRAGALLYLPSPGLLGGGAEAVLLLNGTPIGRGSASAGPLHGDEMVVPLSNPDTRVLPGAVLGLSVPRGLDGRGGLLSGLLGSGQGAPRLVIVREPLPAPVPTPAAPTPAAAPSPAAAPPANDSPMSSSPPAAPAGSAPPGANDGSTARASEAPEGADPPSRSWDRLVDAQGALLLLLLASAALGGWAVVNLGRT